ncbi:Type IV prepilin peptidase TadV/CpaA [Thermogutta terrifontis]|uniref:Type IV prepilin peptidase TadV/CpaA n=1 Tax=Thermogutta terrifontis TaxID=1331910 RepID=A0A286RD24_9BACT|nr:A24 family peptidase [Thermogutta terrifontis]ASV73852.1 Type IV prepilin peptidase TadV/CpaA [Thermogutta terrifontis]
MVYILLLFLTAAVVSDVRTRRIFNWITYPGILAGLLLNGLGDLAVMAGWASSSWMQTWGVIGLGQAVTGFLACGLVMVACYVFFRIGGGDVKLIAMIGAYLGPEDGIIAMLWTFVLGACVALSVLVWRVGPVRFVMHLGRRLMGWLRVGYWGALTPEEQKALEPTLFLAPNAWLAVVIVHFRVVERLLGQP